MALGEPYSTGTITVATGATTATFTGAMLTAHALRGDEIHAGAGIAIIKQVTGDNQLEFELPWAAASLAGAEYRLLKRSWLRYDPAITQARVSELLTVLAGAGIIIQVSGAAPDPALGEEGNFAVKTNVAPWAWWQKTGGVWVQVATPELSSITQDVGGNIAIAGDLAASGWIAATSRLFINGPAETFRGCLLQTNSVGRFDIGINNHPEAGANTGSDLYINSFADDGTFLRTDLAISRASGKITVGSLRTVGNFTSASVVTGLSMRADGLAGTFRGYGFLSSEVYRFDIAVTDQAETGGNAGSDLIVNRFADDGTYLGTALSISRASGECLINSGVALTATRPVIDNAFSCGNASYRWSQVFAADGVIQTCDARDKDVIGPLPGAWAAATVDAIEVMLYRRRVGGYVLEESATETEINGVGERVPKKVPVPVPGVRLHAGVPAQAIKAALDAGGLDFAVWSLADKNDPDSTQQQRPDQVGQLLWAALRETRAELAQARAEIAALQNRTVSKSVSKQIRTQ